MKKTYIIPQTELMLVESEAIMQPSDPNGGILSTFGLSDGTPNMEIELQAASEDDEGW